MTKPNPHQQPQQGRSPAALILGIIVGLIALFTLGALAGYGFYRATNSSEENPLPPTTTTVAAPATSTVSAPAPPETPQPVTETQTVTATVIPPHAGDITRDTGLKIEDYLLFNAVNCTDEARQKSFKQVWGLAGSTSCEFARAVASGYHLATYPQDEDVVIEVPSSVTGESYSMDCRVVDTYVDCAGGEDARVFLLP